MNIRIYQIEMDRDKEKMKFESLETTLEFTGQVDPSIYSQVYSGSCDCNNLEEVFGKFNSNEDIPGFYGHSLSVSDVVEISDDEDKGTYFCNPVGFEKIDFDTSAVPKEDMMRILVLEPHKEPYEMEIRNDLKGMQSVVGGLIEPIYFTVDDDVVMFANDEGRLDQLEGNRHICGVSMAGNLFITGDSMEGECVSLTDEQVEKYSQMFRTPEDISQDEIQADCRIEVIGLN